MTPDEKFSKDVLLALNKIKERVLYATKNRPILYEIDLPPGPISSNNDEVLVLGKLQELGAIAILGKKNLPHDYCVEKYQISIELRQPKFDEIYEQYHLNKGWPKPISIEEDGKKRFSSIYHQPTSQLQPLALSPANQKKLCVLEKLKEEWDLAPKKNIRPTMLQAGLVVHATNAGEATVSWQECTKWEQECGIN